MSLLFEEKYKQTLGSKNLYMTLAVVGKITNKIRPKSLFARFYQWQTWFTNPGAAQSDELFLDSK